MMMRGVGVNLSSYILLILITLLPGNNQYQGKALNCKNPKGASGGEAEEGQERKCAHLH